MESIEKSDILYKDDLVSILHPEVKKGIIIWTHYAPSLDIKLGLKTGKQLYEEGVDFGRTTIHPYIFFRAPYYSRSIDYTTLETEIISSYGKNKLESTAYIRVDPDNTFVFSSEIRAAYSPNYMYNSQEYINKMSSEVAKSKKKLSTYLNIISKNQETDGSEQYLYNLYTSVKMGFPKEYDLKYPWNKHEINRNSEILVSIPHLTPDYFIN